MGRIRIISPADRSERLIQPRGPEGTHGGDDGEVGPGTMVHRHWFPNPDVTHLELSEVTMPPDRLVDPHAHTHDEILYVVEGSITVGKRHLGPGTAVFVEHHTLYSFRSGADGCRLLNFRADGDVKYLSRDALRELRTAD